MKKSHKKLYIDIVENLRMMSSDSREKVGAILLKNGRIVATGYNGQLPGQPHKPIMQNTHDIGTVHSEQNLICFCAKEGISTEGTEIIVSHSPCQVCTKLLIMSGVKKVYYMKAYRIDENPFRDLIEMEQIK